MFKYTLGRILGIIPTLGLLLAMIFLLLRLAPGGPFDGERDWPPEIKANVEAKYGLRDPLPVQLFAWFNSVAHGDLRESFQYIGKPVTEILSESLPASLMLGVWALFFSVTLGILLGCLAAWSHPLRGWRVIDSVTVWLSIAGMSLPNYVFASLLILVFSIWMNWLPPALMDQPGALILPIAALTLHPMAMILRLSRASLLEALQQDYIRTAHSKGLSSRVIVFKHALKNSLIPVVTLLGPITANLLTGSFVVESIFQIPGLGKHFVSGVMNRDYPLVMGIALLYGTVLIFSNLAVDLAYHLIDPRMSPRTAPKG